MKRSCAIFLAFTSALFAQSVQDDSAKLLTTIRSGSIRSRALALQELLADQKSLLREPAVRETLIRLLYKENSRKTWNEDAESQIYAAYYGELLDVVTVIAESRNGTDRDSAWRALVLSNYNDDSGFARSLAARRAAQPTMLAVATDKATLPVTEARVLVVLAQSCELTRNKCDEIRQIIRAQASSSDEWIMLAVVRAIGICGVPTDLRLLSRLGEKSPDPYFVKFTKEAQEQIRQREKGERSAPAARRS